MATRNTPRRLDAGAATRGGACRGRTISVSGLCEIIKKLYALHYGRHATGMVMGVQAGCFYSVRFGPAGPAHSPKFQAALDCPTGALIAVDKIRRSKSAANSLQIS